jgi:predicted metal-dependent phosphoesterase TrpH
MQLVNGVELSCTWGGATIHVLGYGFDSMPAVARGHRKLHVAAGCAPKKSPQAGRQRHARRARRRARVQQELGDSGNAPARPHFADWMVRAGTSRTAPKRFASGWAPASWATSSSTGRPSKKPSPRCAQSNAWVSLAHPMHYDLTRSKRRRLIADYIQAGGQALEVVNGMMPAEQVGTCPSLPVSSACWQALAVISTAPAPGARSVPTGLCPRTCHLCGVDST